MVNADSIFVLRRVVLRRDDKTLSFTRSSVHNLQYVYQLLLVIQSPNHLIIVSSSEVYHDVSISEEEHDCARIIQFVHCVEVGHLRDVNDVEHGKFLDGLRALDEDLIILHACLVGIVTESDAHDSVFFL